MSDEQIAEIASTLSPADRAKLVMRYWRRGNLTPLGIANSLARRHVASGLSGQAVDLRDSAD